MLKVDDNKCIGCGQCVASCEEVFDFNDEGHAYVINQDTENYKEEVEDAIENCPTNAIEREK